MKKIKGVGRDKLTLFRTLPNVIRPRVKSRV